MKESFEAWFATLDGTETIVDVAHKAYLQGYREGCKDSEGTKNGIQRYQIGYEDGKKDTSC